MERQRDALGFWDLVVDGADSITLRLIFNGLRAAYEPVVDLLSVLKEAEVSRPFADGAGRRDHPDTAPGCRAATNLLRPGTDALLSALGAMEDPMTGMPAPSAIGPTAADHRVDDRRRSGRLRGFLLAAPVADGRRPRCLVMGGSWWAPAPWDAILVRWWSRCSRLRVGGPRRASCTGAHVAIARSRSTRCSPASTASTMPTRGPETGLHPLAGTHLGVPIVLGISAGSATRYLARLHVDDCDVVYG